MRGNLCLSEHCRKLAIMTTLYLVRHGHTLVADDGIVAGFNDVALSDKGKESITALKRSLGSKHIDFYLTSDLIRAQQTMSLLTSESFQADVRIKEINFGDWEGLSWDAVHQSDPQALNTWSEDWVNNRPPNGESFTELAERCGLWLKEQATKTHNSCLVTAHGGSIRALLCVALDIPLRCAMQFEIDHASVTKLVLHAKGNRAIYVNRPEFDVNST